MSFFAELKRRNVFRVGIAYLISSWLLAQIAELLLDTFGAPDWTMKFIVVALLIGFPIAIFFAWAFELTPDGVKRETAVERDHSIAPQTGKKLNNTILVLMALAIAYLLFDKFSAPAQPGTDHFSQQASSQTIGANEKSALSPIEATTPKRQSIAVLPFANRSNEEGDLFFTDGIHDDLLTQLAKIADLKVVSRTSVMKYKNTEKTIPEIAAELGVSTILEGGIQRAGDRIRINAQLIEVEADEHLWAETFDREMTIENIFEIQSEITRQIVRAVKGELSDEETEALAKMPTDSLAAYEAYLHAKTILNQPDYNPEKFEAAEIWATKAVENDPEFALAWAMLVSIHGQAIWLRSDTSPQRHQLVQGALARATEYGPFLAETLAARGEYLYRVENDFHAAETAFRSAIKAKPGDAELFDSLAIALRRTGKWEEAISNFQLAIELNPEDIKARTGLIDALISIGEYGRAEPLVDLWTEKFPQAMDMKGHKTAILMFHHGDLVAARNWHDQLVVTSSSFGYWTIATNLPLLERNYSAVINEIDRSMWSASNPDSLERFIGLVKKSEAYRLSGDQVMAAELVRQAIDTIATIDLDLETDFTMSWYRYNLTLAYLQIDQADQALQEIETALNLMPESRDNVMGVTLSNMRALALAMAGRRDEALVEIERLLNTPAGLNRWNLYLSPAWDFFRDDERFNELIKPLNLEEAAS